AADFVMTRCVHDDCLPMNAHDHTITFDFRYLNDASMFSSNGLCGKQKATAERNSTELSKMIDHGRDELLHHRLVIALLAFKWARLNRLYYIHLLAYTLFLAVFTSFMLLTDAPYLFKNETITNMKEICVILDNANEKAYRHHVLFPKYATMIFCVINLIAEILQFIRDGLLYLNLENLLEVAIYVLTLLTIVDSNMCMMRTGLREDWQWNCGTLGLFLAWNNLLLFVRRGPVFGIFVIMFVSVSLTFVKFICVFSPFLIAFALSFHALLTNQNAFKNMQNSLIKTFVMTIGEVDLGDIHFIFQHLFERYSSTEPDKQVHYEFLTYLLFIIFLALMCIVMMNLLVGLAVDDIKAVQRKATLKRQEMRVELLLAMESTLSRFGQLTAMPARYDYRPNRRETNVDMVFHQGYCNYQKTTKDLDVKPEDESVDFAEIEKAVKSIRVQNLEIAKLLNKVVDRLNMDSGAYRRTSASRSKRSARNAPLAIASTSGMPQLDLSAGLATEEGPQLPSDLAEAPAPTIERLNVDEDYDQEPVLFSA
ncbi:Transient receptor potential cation channel subfamily A member 1, partial [Fasciolopsis buskii]